MSEPEPPNEGAPASEDGDAGIRAAQEAKPARADGGSSRGGDRSLKESVAKAVKESLHEYYVTGRISSKEDFKHLARDVTHKWIAKMDSGRERWHKQRSKEKIKRYVDKIFERSFLYVRASR